MRIQCTNIVLLLSLVVGLGANAFRSRRSYDSLDNLGEQISRSVQEGLKPLENLGYRISSRVQADMEPLNNLGERINANVHRNLAHLDNLGAQINQQVQESLEPVRALAIKLQMKDGVGGKTIVKYSPNGKTFIHQNGDILQCDGSISNENGECSGSLTPFKPINKEDFCYSTSYSNINNMICVSTAGISVQVINNKVSCSSFNNSPILVIPADEYNKLCKDKSEEVSYKYFANEQDPRHIQIPNQNRHVTCSNNEKGVCEFSEKNFSPIVTHSNTFVYY